MDSSVIEILKRQQILETFKSSGYEKETEINSTQYGQNILRVCRTSSFKRNKYRKSLPLPVLLPLQPLCFPLQMWDIYG